MAAFGVSCYYLPFVFMIGNAIAQSAQPIISYNFGIGNRERIRAALRISLLTAVVCGTFSTVAFLFFPEWLVGLFLNYYCPLNMTRFSQHAENGVLGDFLVATSPYC